VAERLIAPVLKTVSCYFYPENVNIINILTFLTFPVYTYTSVTQFLTQKPVSYAG